MRLVVDTNVVVSGLLWSGTRARLLRAAFDGQAKLVTGRAALAELDGTMFRPKLVKRLDKLKLTGDEALDRYRMSVAIIPIGEIRAICRDPDDDLILATALAAKADLLVSGDDDLLTLESYEGIEIVTPAEALRRISPPPE